MSKRKHHFTVTSFAELAKAFLLAVTEKIIPEKREQKVDYSYIAGLLDRKIAVPGIEIHDQPPQAANAPIAANSESSKAVTPHFLTKKHN